MGFIQRNKTPFIASSTTVYYYNNNWQVLSEYDGSNNFQRSCVYGNYIDEVLMMTDSDSHRLYCSCKPPAMYDISYEGIQNRQRELNRALTCR